MSTRCEYYVMIGAKLSGDWIDDNGGYEAWEHLMDQKEGKVGIVYDGMSGKYCYIGRVVRVSDVYEEPEAFNITATELSEECARLESILANMFNVSGGGMALYTFFHYH